MGNYKVKMKGIDDKLDVKVMDVTIGQKKFVTPFKTLNIPSPGSLLEIYQNVDEDMIKKSRDGPSKLDDIPSKCKSNTVNLIIPSYSDTKISDLSLRDLESRIHPHTDAVIIPRWEGILRSNNETKLFDDIWSMTERYVEEIRRINGKLIMGNLPLNRPQSVVDGLVSKYVDTGITSFVLDYEQCNAPGKAYLVRNLQKELEKLGYSEESLLYSINMKKSHDYNGMMPADDLLSFINGVDILGNYHLTGGGGKKDTIKVFDQLDWTYVNSPLNGRSYANVALDNHIKMNKETELVRMEIEEKGTALNMVKTKKGAAEYTRFASQTTLNFGGLVWD